ncbi:Multiple sugar-binding transport ATP-binding protein MsmK, partial [Durusdinium trenchii]
TVFQNIALPLTMRHLNAFSRVPGLGRLAPGSATARELITKKVTETADILSLADLLHRKPTSLSGGQKQRVALGRALVRDPVMFLLDELRVKMRSELVSLHKRTDRPFVYVTHDQVEAMAMADQIIVMIKGKVAQAGSPRDLYDRPADKEVAAFIGTNSINFFEPDDGLGQMNGYPVKALIGIRPEHLAPAAGGQFGARLETAEFLGSETVLGLRTERGKEILAIAPGDYPFGARSFGWIGLDNYEKLFGSALGR